MSDLLSRITSALSDRYRIERELVAGGMATVYLAEDLKHNRMFTVADGTLLNTLEVSLADDPRTYAYMEREVSSFLFELKGLAR
jgi:hypothetical protein